MNDTPTSASTAKSRTDEPLFMIKWSTEESLHPGRNTKKDYTIASLLLISDCTDISRQENLLFRKDERLN